MVPEGGQISKEDGLAPGRTGEGEWEPEPWAQITEALQCPRCLWTAVPMMAAQLSAQGRGQEAKHWVDPGVRPPGRMLVQGASLEKRNLRTH